MNRQSAIKNHQSAGGYAGKILRLNLTERKASTIPTSDYAQWGGGHGMGSAIFFDLVKDKTIDGFDPANVVTIMTSPLCGTLVPAAGGRTEVQGIGVQSYPIGWFTRSNFGGRFSAQLKYAGWDGIVIEGRADEPVWAIGTGKVATPEQAEEVHAQIRDLITARYGRQVAKDMRILYGGSVKPGNAEELLSQPNIDGALVGGASLTVQAFGGIIQAANKIAKSK